MRPTEALSWTRRGPPAPGEPPSAGPAVALPAAAPPRRLHRRIGRHASLAGIVLAALTLAVTGLTVRHLRDRAIEDATSDTRTLGAVLADQTTRYVQVMDLLLEELQGRAERLDLRTSGDFRRRMGDTATGDIFRQRIKSLPQAHAIAILDGNGDPLASSRPEGVPRANFADRDYFARARDIPNDGLFISLPTISRMTGRETISLSRRISSPDGAFLGVALVAVDVSYLLDFYRTVSGERHFSVTLVRRDGTFLARHPDAGLVGKRIPESVGWYDVARDGGTYLSPGKLTGKRTIVSVNLLHRYPLVLDVSIRMSEALSAWRRLTIYAGIGSIVAAVSLILLFTMAVRQIRQQEEHTEALQRSARALRQSEVRFRDFTYLASDWFWEQDVEFRFTDFGPDNPASPRAPQSLIGKQRWEVADTSKDPERWERHRRDLEAHRPFADLRYALEDTRGRLRHITVSGMPLYDETGAFAGYRGIGRDVAAMVEAEQEVQGARERVERAERLLQDAVDSLSESVVIFDAEDRLTTCNERYRRVFSSCPDALVPGVRFENLVREALAGGDIVTARGHTEEWLSARMRAYREAVGGIEHQRTDGRWFLTTDRRMRNGGTVGLRIDITPLKQAQAALRESEERLEHAQEIAGIGSWELDVQVGRFVWSKQLHRIFNLRFDREPTRDEAEAMVSPEDRTVLGLWLADLQAGRDRLPIDIRILPPQGGTRAVCVEGRAVAEPNGKIRRIAGTMQDVTERRLIERQLTRAHKMGAIGNLTGGLAHDFNNVLSVIIGNLDLLQRLIKDDAMATELCGDALAGASRCAGLIRRLLAFAHRQPLRPASTDMNALVSETARLLRRTLSEHVVLNLHLDLGLRPVMADPSQLEAALVNFAANARDAMPKGGRLGIATSNVTLDAEYAATHPDVAPGNYGLIEITDTGTGIPPEIIGRIFDAVLHH